MDSRRRLAENIVSLTTVQLLSYVAPLITVPYLFRVLQPAQFGLLSFAQGIALYFDLITDYGFNLSTTRAIAAHRHVPGAVSRIFWSTFYAKSVLMLGSAVAFTSLVWLIPKLRETPSVFAASFLYVIGTTLFPVWLFQGLEKMKLIVLTFGLARLLTIPALLLSVHRPQDCVKAAAIQAGVEVAASVFAAPIVWKHIQIGWYRPSLYDIADAYRQGWPLFVSGAALHLCTSSATVILGFVANQAEVGYYSAADKLIKASIAAINPLSQTLYPHVTAIKEESTVSALKLIRKSLLVIGSLSFGVSLLTFTLAQPVCRALLGNSMGPTSFVLQCLSPLPLLFGLMSVLGTQTMLVFDMDLIMSRIMLISAAIGILLTATLSFLWGAAGTAAASVIVAILMTLKMLFALRSCGLSVWQRRTAVSQTSQTVP
ncbi:MAG: flippase [Acidobacteriaceae bacterium]|nr:flippase [Acidobacteriaceae bacterium]